MDRYMDEKMGRTQKRSLPGEKGQLFLTVELQRIKVERMIEIEKSLFGNHYSTPVIIISGKNHQWISR